MFSVQKDRYARIWHRQWETLGTSRDDEITGIDDAQWNYAEVHVRLSAERPEPDFNDKLFTYGVRLKVYKRGNVALATAVADALKTVDGIAKHVKDDKNQFTVPIETNRQLPSITTDAATVTD